MKVYRFEKEGIGPYNSYQLDDIDNIKYNDYSNDKMYGSIKKVIPKFEHQFKLNEKLMNHRTYSGHADIFRDIEDIGIFNEDDFDNVYSGCLSIADLKNWFKNILTLLYRLGFKIYEYDMNREDVFLTDSGRQVGFYKDKAISKRIVK